MSLDVYLTLPRPERPGAARRAIFVRRDGRRVEISRREWDELYPGREPATVLIENDGCVFTANITHNLGPMAALAGLYEPLWRPEEDGLERAEQLIGPLRDGLELLRADRARFERLNPENGWGDYDGLVAFTAEYLAACERWPAAEVSVSR